MRNLTLNSAVRIIGHRVGTMKTFFTRVTNIDLNYNRDYDNIIVCRHVITYASPDLKTHLFHDG